ATENLPLHPLEQLVAVRLHPAATIAHLPVLEAEHMDHALAIDEDIVGTLARILPVRAHPVERAFQPLGNRALDDFQAVDAGLAAQRSTPALEQWIVGKA